MTVCVVISTYNDAIYLPDALASVDAQTRPADQIIVVDDGSTDDPSTVVAQWPRARLVRQGNLGPSGARNRGLAETQASHVVFLDADDRLVPQAIAAGLAAFETNPGAVMVYGGHRRTDLRFRPTGPDQLSRVGTDSLADMLTGNLVAMLSSAMFRTEALRSIGGFDEGLRFCEDYDLFIRLAHAGPIAWHATTVAEYRQHHSNASADPAAMLQAALAVHQRYAAMANETGRAAAWAAGRRNWQEYYNAMATPEAPGSARFRRLMTKVKRRIERPARQWSARTTRKRLGPIDFGDLGTTTPFSFDFGFDRGRPIDRYYIENFLEEHASDIAGRVLEVGDDAYSRRFGGNKVARQDVLHIDAEAPGVTIGGDLTTDGVLPTRAFDCIVLTQTLQLIFEPARAVERLYDALRPGGVLLVTVPGIAPLERGRWGEMWYWSFTRPSLRRLFEPLFGADGVEVTSHGNVFSATCMLQGIAVEEVDEAKLDVFDAAYPLLLTVRARRGPA